jgi:hypothetical protein
MRSDSSCALPVVLATNWPEVSLPIPVPADTFKDTDSSALTYRASLANNIGLPAWLAFDPATGTFTGTPPADWTVSSISW